MTISSLLITPLQHPISRFDLVSSLLVLIVVFIVSRFYLQVSRYSKGPFSYPIIGNLTYMNAWTSTVNPHETLSKLHLKYGSIFTIWMSHNPFVFITDPQLIKEAFQKPEFSDRGFKYFGKAVTMDRGQDFAFNDYNQVYVEQKKLVISAIRKYVMTDEISKATNECVEEFWNQIKNQGLEKLIDMPKNLHLIIVMIITRSLYGTKNTLDDPELLFLKNALKKAPRAVDLMNLLDGLPDAVAQFLFNLLIKTSWLGFPEISRTMSKKFKEHLDSYEEDSIRDVVDALIAAKEEAILENKESAAYFNDVNLTNILADLFIAGTDTITIMFEWIFLLMAKYPDMQSEMRREICSVVQDRLPTKQDKEKCHFTMAFINEALRLHTPGPFGLAHQNKTDVQLGGHTISGQTPIIGYYHSVHLRADYWSRPDQFDPNRMLDAEGKLQINKLEALMPFSLGRRSCPGEKLVQIDGFLIVARMLQLADQLSLEFAGVGPIEVKPDPKMIAFPGPVHYKLVLKRQSTQ